MRKLLIAAVIGLTAIISVGCAETSAVTVSAPTVETTISETTASEITTETTVITDDTTTSTTVTTSTTTDGTTTTSVTTDNITTSDTTSNKTSEVASSTTIGCITSAEALKVTEVTKPAKTEIKTTETTVETTETTTVETTTSVETTTVETEETVITTEPETKVELLSIEEIAREVWAGKWGNGSERKERLTAAGYNYDEVQAKVAELKGEYKTSNDVSSTTSGGVSLGNFRITGYVATGNKTASGTWPAAGRTIAMNKSQKNALGLSWGDQIYIEGLGTYTLEDCGCKWGVIDVFCNTVSQCYALTSYANAYKVN